MKLPERAIVKVSACGIFAEPTFKSEMVNQALELEQVEIVDRKDSWLKICLMPDGYRGWIHEMYLNDLTSSEDYLKDIDMNKFSNFPIIKTALEMLGKPYLWGGRSSQGYDCSGLIQTTMNSLGFQFPRDTKDQINSDLLYEIELEDVKEQDFLFFQENNVVSHVAISISESIKVENNSKLAFHIIHSSGMVRVSRVIFDKLLYAFIDEGNKNEIKLYKAMRLKENE